MGIACQNKAVITDVWLLLPHTNRIKVDPESSVHSVYDIMMDLVFKEARRLHPVSHSRHMLSTEEKCLTAI